MKDLVLYLVKQIVSHPDEVAVEELGEEGNIDLVLSLNPEDYGMVIGKKGQTIKALRKILIVRAMHEGVRINLRLAEDNQSREQAVVAQ